LQTKKGLPGAKKLGHQKQLKKGVVPPTREEIRGFFLNSKVLFLEEWGKFGLGNKTPERGKIFSDPVGQKTRAWEGVGFGLCFPPLGKGRIFGNVGSKFDRWSMRQPLGGWLGIPPFIFLVCFKVMFVVLCMRYFIILKPSEKDPTVPYMMGDY
jgi:NAD-dependent aldehyde dehydrogenases